MERELLSEKEATTMGFEFVEDSAMTNLGDDSTDNGITTYHKCTFKSKPLDSTDTNGEEDDDDGLDLQRQRDSDMKSLQVELLAQENYIALLKAAIGEILGQNDHLQASVAALEARLASQDREIAMRDQAILEMSQLLESLGVLD